MFKSLQTTLKKLSRTLHWSLIALFDGKCALAECDMTDPVITDTERLGRPCDRFDEDDEDWKARDRIAEIKKDRFCEACKKRTAAEQRIAMIYHFTKYTIAIDCMTCKKHKE